MGKVISEVSRASRQRLWRLVNVSALAQQLLLSGPLFPLLPLNSKKGRVLEDSFLEIDVSSSAFYRWRQPAMTTPFKGFRDYFF